MLYIPYAGPITPEEAHLSHYRLTSFTSVDALNIPYWEHQAGKDAPILLYFHGNGGGLHAFTPTLQYLADANLHVIAMEYRGYPGAPGKPSQAALVQDAVTLFDAIKQRYPQRPIAIWGYSLGSGIATQLAVQRHVDALVLEAPFTSTADRAQELMPLIPISLLMHDQFRSADVIANVHTPLFIMHGDEDVIIPEAMGKALFEAAAEPKTYHHYPQAGHLNLNRTPAYKDALAFLNRALKSKQYQ